MSVVEAFEPGTRAHSAASTVWEDAPCDLTAAHLELVAGLSTHLASDHQMAEVIWSIPAYDLPVRVNPSSIRTAVQASRIALAEYPKSPASLVTSLIDLSMSSVLRELPPQLVARSLGRRACERLFKRSKMESGTFAVFSKSLSKDDALSVLHKNRLAFFNPNLDVLLRSDLDKAITKFAKVTSEQLRMWPTLALKSEVLADAFQGWEPVHGEARLLLLASARNATPELLAALFERGGNNVKAEAMRNQNFAVDRVRQEWDEFLHGGNSCLHDFSQRQRAVAAGNPMLGAELQLAIVERESEFGGDNWPFVAAIDSPHVSPHVRLDNFAERATDLGAGEWNLLNRILPTSAKSQERLYLQAGSLSAQLYCAVDERSRFALHLPAADIAGATATELLRSDREFRTFHAKHWNELPRSADWSRSGRQTTRSQTRDLS